MGGDVKHRVKERLDNPALLSDMTKKTETRGERLQI